MKTIFYRVLTIAWMAAIILLSIQPVLKSHGTDILWQIFNNMLHIPAYGLLTFLLIKGAICHCEAASPPKAAGQPKQSNTKYIYLASFLFALAFGVFNEYLQSFVPGRCASALDVLLNGIGSLIVVLFYAKRYPLTAKHAINPKAAPRISQL